MAEQRAPTIRIALAGNPNCGKSALFNAMTGSRERVGNYPGVTVEKREGSARGPSGTRIRLIDLPGAYSLNPRTPDEEITREVILGLHKSEPAPDLIIAVADASNLSRSLGFALELKSAGRPLVLVLNMIDIARGRGAELDLKILSEELGIPVVATVATQARGSNELLQAAEELLRNKTPPRGTAGPAPDTQARFAEIDRVLKAAFRHAPRPALWTERIDRFVLHPFFGSILLFLILAFLFQAIFNWANTPMEWIRAGTDSLGVLVESTFSEGPLRSLLVHGVIAGVGSVLVFVPQILLLFLFILVLEDSGYMARAAFLMDRLMGRVGLHGRAFIPLLSSFACAVPGIMATRTLESKRDRLATILVAPLITCSARLPVYALLIAAFIPNRGLLSLAGFELRLQGLVMLGLYFAGVIASLAMAFLFRKTLLKGPPPPLLMELPSYKWPTFRNLALGLMERLGTFLRRAGTVILALAIVLWFLASYPKPAPITTSQAAALPPLASSYAGQIGRALEPIFRPLGFNWQIVVALIPGFAAREMMIGALATVYSIEASTLGTGGALSTHLARDWSVATGLSLLVWYVLSCQCFSTLAVTRRETNSWRWPVLMLVYMTVLAYVGSFLTFQFVRALGGG